MRGKRERKRRTLTRAPITPREVSLRYSNGRVFEVVFKNGYKNNGICAVVINKKSAQTLPTQPKHKAHHSRTTVSYPDAKPRTGVTQGHCTLGSIHVL